MEYFLFWIYVLIFCLSNFMLFHFWLLRAYKPKLFSLDRKIIKQKIEKPSLIFNSFALYLLWIIHRLSFRESTKDYNIKLATEYSPDKKINRWSRLLLKSRILILISILIASTTTISVLEKHHNISLDNWNFVLLIFYCQLWILGLSAFCIFIKCIICYLIYIYINICIT